MNSGALAVNDFTTDETLIIAELQGTIERQQREIELLNQKLQYLLHQRFGRKSEQSNPAQGSLFAIDEAVVTEEAEPEVEVEPATPRKGGRRRPPKDLPRVRIEHDLSEADKRCTCGACRERISEERSEQYDIVPPRFQVLEHVRYTYACPNCDRGMVTAPKAPDPLPRSQVSPGLLAWIGTGKFVDGLPLHRQARILERRFGVAFTRTTLSNWMILAALRLLVPFAKAMEPHLLGRDYLHVDETTLQVLEEPERYAWQKSYLWVRATGAGTGPPILLVDYSPTRAGAVATGLLDGFAGYLQVDGYSGYNEIAARDTVVVLGCWAHARRKFDAVIKSTGRLSREGVLARQALEHIQQLYRIEKAHKDQPPAVKQARRQSESRAVLDQLRHWLDDHLESAARSGGALAKACGYLANQWPRLVRFVEDGRLHLDNNPAERHIRPIAVGRTAWLFCQSQTGAHATAAWYSVVETAKANGWEPYHYLRWLFTALPKYLEANLPLDPLFPWNVTPADATAPLAGRG